MPTLSLLFLLLLLLHLYAPPVLVVQCLPEPDPETIQPLVSTPRGSPPAVIPAFPEQSNDEECPLSLPNELFHGIKSACSAHTPEQLQRGRCCPVLAAWLYSAYSATALLARPPAAASNSYEMPVLPDDSETCVEAVEEKVKARGIELFRPNETCDLVDCYCGIRLHPLSCPEVFRVNGRGKLVGDRRVRRLERNCLSGNSYGRVDRFPGLGACSNCLTTLHSLTSNKTSVPSKSPDDRTTKMHDKDCKLMGLTWLLSKNRTAYFPTVSAVLRAMMLNADGSYPQSCTLGSDGMPLAVDSSQLSSSSASISRQGWTLMISLVPILHLLFIVLRITCSL